MSKEPKTAEIISAAIAAPIFVVLIVMFVYILLTRKIHNKFTKIAYVEMVVALALRTVSCVVFAICYDHNWLNSRLFDVAML